MSDEPSIRAFAGELHFLCMRFMDEFDMDLASIVGTLKIEEHVLISAAIEEADSKENQDVIDEDDDDEE